MSDLAQMEYYYNSAGAKVLLERDPSLYAVRYRHAGGVRALRREARSAHAGARHLRLIPNYRFQLYRSDLRVEVGRAVRTMNEDPEVELAVPVFRVRGDSGTLAIGTDSFIIEFAANVDLSSMQRQLDLLNAEWNVHVVDQLSWSLPRLGLLLRAPNTDGSRGPVQLARHYYEIFDGNLIYAAPNLIRRRSFGYESEPRAGSLRDIATATLRDQSWTYEDEQWHLWSSRVPEAWVAHGYGFSSISVAVLDNGIDIYHPEFANRIGPQYDFSLDTDDGSPKLSSDRHGTACAGVSVAGGIHCYGVAPGCNLIPVRFPEYLASYDEARMFEWAADSGADVISCSWGPEDGLSHSFPLPDHVRSAIHYCVTRGRGGRGIPIFWAAGNGGESIATDGYAINPDVMTIGAITERDQRADYSDYGSELFLVAPSSGSEVQGERAIFTTDRQGQAGYNIGNSPDMQGNYTNDFGGTSAAAPFTAGVAALMLSANPALRVGEIRDILRETAVKIGGTYDTNGHSNYLGFGMVDAMSAVSVAATREPGVVTTPVFRIEGPNSVERDRTPPSFAVFAPIGRFWAVEVATDPTLFDTAANAAARTADNFYGSWSSSLRSGASYDLPDPVWHRLATANKLYYRLWISSNRDAWVDAIATTANDEAANAPAINITVPAPAGSAISGPDLLSRSGDSPIFNVTLAEGHSYAVEVATEARLLDGVMNVGMRTPDNFYASWYDSGLLVSSTYKLPQHAWLDLSRADRLYYRLLTSARFGSWVDTKSIPSGDFENTALSIRILD